MSIDERRQQLRALGVVEKDDLDAEFLEPLVAPVEVLGLANDDRTDVELAHES